MSLLRIDRCIMDNDGSGRLSLQGLAGDSRDLGHVTEPVILHASLNSVMRKWADELSMSQKRVLFQENVKKV